MQNGSEKVLSTAAGLSTWLMNEMFQEDSACTTLHFMTLREKNYWYLSIIFSFNFTHIHFAIVSSTVQDSFKRLSNYRLVLLEAIVKA